MSVLIRRRAGGLFHDLKLVLRQCRWGWRGGTEAGLHLSSGGGKTAADHRATQWLCSYSFRPHLLFFREMKATSLVDVGG